MGVDVRHLDVVFHLGSVRAQGGLCGGLDWAAACKSKGQRAREEEKEQRAIQAVTRSS
jgi:hypothetical protein